MYKLMKDLITGETAPFICRISDNANIPCDPNNSDYIKYLKWLDGYELQHFDWVKVSDGNTPLPADE